MVINSRFVAVLASGAAALGTVGAISAVGATVKHKPTTTKTAPKHTTTTKKTAPTHTTTPTTKKTTTTHTTTTKTTPQAAPAPAVTSTAHFTG